MSGGRYVWYHAVECTRPSDALHTHPCDSQRKLYDGGKFVDKIKRKHEYRSILHFFLTPYTRICVAECKWREIFEQWRHDETRIKVHFALTFWHPIHTSVRLAEDEGMSISGGKHSRCGTRKCELRSILHTHTHTHTLAIVAARGNAS